MLLGQRNRKVNSRRVRGGEGEGWMFHLCLDGESKRGKRGPEIWVKIGHDGTFML